MKNRLAIFNTDTLNRAGILFPAEVLVKGFLRDGRTGAPYLLNHDFHKAFGWTVHNGLLLQPAMVKTVGNIFIPTNEEETDQILGLIENSVNTMHRNECKEHIPHFLALLAENHSEDGRFLYDCCVAYKATNVLSRVYPSLNYDKNGLVFLQELLLEFDYLGSGVFANKRDKFTVFAHQYFRRNLSHQNSTNNDFLDRFISRNGNKDYSLRIALDKNLIGLKDTYQAFLEQDFAWGPLFNDDISALPDGVTKYRYPENEKGMSGIEGMEFWWKTDGAEKTLEAEEICIEPSKGVSDDQFGCRYIHSIFDAGINEFVHFDGAIRLYDEEGIMSRWDHNINKAGKNTDYTKLFRIDGKLPLADWKELILFYFRGNDLPYEYFGVKQELEEFMNVPDATPENFSPYVPYRIAKENGVQLYVTLYNENGNLINEPREITDLDQLQYNGNNYFVCESSILEIQKILAREGETLAIPSDLKIIKAYDYYTNFPTISHSKENTVELLAATMRAYKILFEHWNSKMEMTVSFAVAAPFDGGLLKISFFGQVFSVLEWMNANPIIPLDKKIFEKWLVEQANWLKNKYRHEGHNIFQQLIKGDGIQYIKRLFIDEAHYDIEEKENGLSISMSKGLNAPFMKELENRSIFPSLLALLTDIRCSRTGEDYRYSSTSKVLDEDVSMVIHGAEKLGVFWSDKSFC